METMMNRQKEVDEAIAAGEKALASLRETEKQLKSASNWGLVDLFGGGFITDVIKHSKISKAQQILEQAKLDITHFQKELGDIQVTLNVNIEISDLLSLADVFFDNIFSDYMVQNKISDAHNQVKTLLQTIENIVNQLKNSR